MLDVVKASQKDCSMIKADWNRIEEMSKTWHSPMTFAYHVGKDMIINGKNIYREVE